MTACLAALTFDFDGMSGFIARGRTSPTMLSRGEFGAVGVERILRLLDRYGIAASFFIPGITIGTWPDHCRRIHEAGHEIGHHGWRHIPPAQLTREEEADELDRGIAAIEALTERRPLGYRSPAWDLSESTVELLLERGFVYDSSMMGHDTQPYRVRRGDVIHEDEASTFGEETALLELPVSWSADDWPHFEFMPPGMPGLRSTSAVLENWLDDFRYMVRHEEGGLMTYTFHPLVIGRGHRMLFLERLIQGLRRLGAEFVRLDDAARRFTAS